MGKENFTYFVVVAPYETFPGSRSSATHILYPCANAVGFLKTYYLIFYNYMTLLNSISEKTFFL